MPVAVKIPGWLAAYWSPTALEFWPRYLTCTWIDAPPRISYGTRQLIWVAVHVSDGGGDAARLEDHLHSPMVVGTFVHGVGQVVLLNDTAVGGPMGAEGLAKMEIISPGETGPVTKLAALVTRAMKGVGAVTVKRHVDVGGSSGLADAGDDDGAEIGAAGGHAGRIDGHRQIQRAGVRRSAGRDEAGRRNLEPAGAGGGHGEKRRRSGAGDGDYLGGRVGISHRVIERHGGGRGRYYRRDYGRGGYGHGHGQRLHAEDVTMPMVPVQVAGAVNEDGSTETVKLVFDVAGGEATGWREVQPVTVVQVCSDT